MTATASTMLALGTQIPEFSLSNSVDGNTLSSSDFANAKAVLVVFTANHCPFAQHTMPGIVKLAQEYADQGLRVVAISSNDVSEYPDDAPEKMKELAITDDYSFPYLYDEDQSVAKAFTAACTPDLFLFDASHQLVYRGQFDDSRPGNDQPLTGADVRAALDQVLSGSEVSGEQKPSVGCNIKWKSGNEPAYA